MLIRGAASEVETPSKSVTNILKLAILVVHYVVSYI